MADPNKIHPNLANRLLNRTLVRAFAAPEQFAIIVKYRAPGAPSEPATVARALRLMRAEARIASRATIAALSERGDVEMIWHDNAVRALLDESAPLIGAPQVWNQGTTGRDVRVAVIDTGIDPDHPDFIDRILAARDFTGEGEQDLHGHGTHVAGIVGGAGAASFGRFQGIAFECALLIGKVLDQFGNGRSSAVIAAIEWAIEQGAQIINLSLGDDQSCDGTDALSQACEVAVARGVCVCAAAGNSGPNPYTIGSPGCAQSVITIGATTKNDLVADFSSRGPTRDERVKPDVCFPGVNVVACRAVGTNQGIPFDQFYTTLSGTSMATPHASGACALILEKFPTLSPGDLKNLLMASAKGLGLAANTQGRGRGDIAKAYSLRAITNVEFDPTTLDTGDLLNVSITVVNQSDATLQTQGPEPGFVYGEGETFYTHGFTDERGAFRVSVDFEDRAGIDHPYRWGLGAPLEPGHSATVTGAVRLRNVQTQDYWVGLVEEQIAWHQDHVGIQRITVNPALPDVAVEIVDVALSPTIFFAGETLDVSITVHNAGKTTLNTQGPEPGLVYEEGETFYTRGFPESADALRVGVDFDDRASDTIDHPYRWGLGAPLAPGESRVITGAIRLQTAQAQNFWAGAVQERVKWHQDRIGVQRILAQAQEDALAITNVTFSPATLQEGELLTVSVTVQNRSTASLATQSPEPGYVYAEGDSFYTRGFPDMRGSFRVGVEFYSRASGVIDHPYRWGLGAPLAPGETRIVAGAIRLRNVQAQNYWVGAVQEYMRWMQDETGITPVVVQ